ncbi:MAG: AAA family ATPase, partial [Nanoarchaeota archaeon]
MTKINKIEMHGFKSFANKTELMFNDSFNCVIGPNGSGKSNILDAICFVLGKSSSKALRAEKSSNLIYNGGKTKNPAKEAVVSIVFDNVGKEFPIKENHVKISRTIRQNGQSIYRMNDKVVTRQQILDMLAHATINPDGYNIILQGDIVRIVEISPDERRKIIEEIAGISIYEEKKRKALNELDKVEESLKEADIVMKEKDTYIRELKKDRDQALKYKELEDKVSQNKASYLHIQIKRKEDEKKKKETEIAGHQKEIDKLNSEIEKLQKESADKRKRIEEINNEIEQKGEKEQVELNKEVEELRVNLATYRTRIENCKQQITQIENRREQIKSDMREIDDKVSDSIKEKESLEKRKKELDSNIEKLDSSIHKIREKSDIEGAHEIEMKIESLEKTADDEMTKIQNLREKQQDLFREKDKIEVNLDNIDEAIRKVKNIENEHKEELRKLKEKKDLFKKVYEELGKSLDDDSSLASQLNTARGKQETIMEELSKLRARNISITEALGASNAAAKILDNKQKFKAYGTVADLGHVKSKYSLALEIAAGNKIKSVVVQDDRAASDCIKYLKSNKLGIATFLPMNKIRGLSRSESAEKLAKMNGVHGFASELVDYDPKFKAVFSYVFGNTLVVDDIDTARKIGINSVRMVTLDGDLIELSGAMQGGYRSRKGHGVGFKEKEVSEGIDRLEAELEDTQNVIKSLEESREENEDKIIKLREQKADLEGDIIAFEKSLHLQSTDMGASRDEKEKLISRMEEIDKEIDSILEEISSVNRKLADIKMEKQNLKQKISVLRDPKALAELNTYEQKRQELKEESIKIQSHLESIKAHIETVAGPEKVKSDNILKQLQKDETNFNSEIKELESKIKESEKSLKSKETEQEKFYKQFKGLFSEKSKLNEAVQKSDAQVSTKNDKIRENERKMNSVGLDAARVKAELAGLEEEFSEYEGVKLVNKAEDVLKQEIKEFERMAQNIGNVNKKALEV